MSSRGSHPHRVFPKAGQYIPPNEYVTDHTGRGTAGAMSRVNPDFVPMNIPPATHVSSPRTATIAMRGTGTPVIGMAPAFS
jgi:hypothetical protein